MRGGVWSLFTTWWAWDSIHNRGQGKWHGMTSEDRPIKARWLLPGSAGTLALDSLSCQVASLTSLRLPSHRRHRQRPHGKTGSCTQIWRVPMQPQDIPTQAYDMWATIPPDDFSLQNLSPPSWGLRHHRRKTNHFHSKLYKFLTHRTHEYDERVAVLEL